MNDNPAPDANPAADTRHLPDDEILLPQLLRKAGYATAMVGKWHLGHRNPEHLPTRRGFDEYLGILYSNDMRPVRLLDGEKVVEDPAVQATLTQRYTERALQFMQAHRRQPFFLYVAHAMPHKPLAASEAFYRKSGAGLYGDVMAELDWSVGRILDALKDLELDQNTLVIFTSDNGPWFGGSTGGLRGMKGSSFEGGYRVPFLARWPGVLPKGALRDQPAVMMDVFTTLLHAAHVTLPPDRVIDGQNLLPYLTTNESPPHDHVFGQAGPRLATIRDGRWKLHVLKPNARRSLSPGETWVDPRGPDGTTILAPVEQSHPSEFPGLETGDAAQPMMLFDLLNDPGEQRDVAGQHHEVVQRLKAAYETMNTALSETPPRP